MIYSAPFENVTVPLGQTTLVNFSCHADGFTVLWIINGTLVDHHDHETRGRYKGRGITFYPDVNGLSISGVNISVGINATTARNNNTELSCCAHNSTTCTKNSTAVTLTIAGIEINE